MTIYYYYFVYKTDSFELDQLKVIKRWKRHMFFGTPCII